MSGYNTPSAPWANPPQSYPVPQMERALLSVWVPFGPTPRLQHTRIGVISKPSLLLILHLLLPAGLENREVSSGVSVRAGCRQRHCVCLFGMPAAAAGCCSKHLSVHPVPALKNQTAVGERPAPEQGPGQRHPCTPRNPLPAEASAQPRCGSVCTAVGPLQSKGRLLQKIRTSLIQDVRLPFLTQNPQFQNRKGAPKPWQNFQNSASVLLYLE